MPYQIQLSTEKILSVLCRQSIAIWIYRKKYLEGLKKAWYGYGITKVKCEHNKMLQYASIIQKLQNELNLPVSNFPNSDTLSKSKT
jgi:hypothetical protein